MMDRRPKPIRTARVVLAVVVSALATAGCSITPTDPSENPAPLRMPAPRLVGADQTYEGSLTGGRVFSMYCSACHNARSLAERPFANYQNVAAHMRTRANLTDTEYHKLMDFLERFHDIPPANPSVTPSPTRPVFAQPISEPNGEAAPPGP